MMEQETRRLEAIRDQMGRIAEQDWTWMDEAGTPENHPLHCPHCSGTQVCGYSSKPENRALREFLPKLESNDDIEAPFNSTQISDLPSRINVKGTIDGGWTKSAWWGSYEGNV